MPALAARLSRNIKHDQGSVCARQQKPLTECVGGMFQRFSCHGRNRGVKRCCQINENNDKWVTRVTGNFRHVRNSRPTLHCRPGRAIIILIENVTVNVCASHSRPHIDRLSLTLFDCDLFDKHPYRATLAEKENGDCATLFCVVSGAVMLTSHSRRRKNVNERQSACDINGCPSRINLSMAFSWLEPTERKRQQQKLKHQYRHTKAFLRSHRTKLTFSVRFSFNIQPMTFSPKYSCEKLMIKRKETKEKNQDTRRAALNVPPSPHNIVD